MAAIKGLWAAVFLLGVVSLLQPGAGAANVNVRNAAALRKAIAEAQDNVVTNILLETDIHIADWTEPIQVSGSKVVNIRARGASRTFLNVTLPKFIEVSSSSQNDDDDHIACENPSNWNVSSDLIRLGDVDGDGFNDFGKIVMAETSLEEFGTESKVPLMSIVVTLGGPARVNPVTNTLDEELNPVSVLRLPSGDTNPELLPLGDFNGDGKADFLIIYTLPSSPFTRRMFLLLGSENFRSGRVLMLNNLDQLSCEAHNIIAGDGLSVGYSQTNRVATRAGDLDGDGLEDLLIGSPPHVFLIFGSASFKTRELSFNPAYSPVIIGERSKDEKAFDFGSVIASGMDFNGDGYIDIIIGNKRRNEVNVVTTSSALFNHVFRFSKFYKVRIHKIPRIRLVGDANDRCGIQIAFHDLDKDGLGDILILCRSGRMFVVYGSRTAWLPTVQETDAQENKEQYLLSQVGVEILVPNKAGITTFSVLVRDHGCDGLLDIRLIAADNRSYTLKSPGSGRFNLREGSGAFLVSDAAHLTLDSLIYAPAGRTLSVVGSKARATITQNFRTVSEYSPNSTLVVCPEHLHAASRADVCQACIPSATGNCPIPCSKLLDRLISRAQARFETNLEGFKIKEIDDRIVVLRYEGSRRRILASVYSFQQNHCVLTADEPITDNAAIYITEAGEEPFVYWPSSPLFYDVVQMDQNSFGVIFLGENDQVYIRPYIDELGSFGDARPVVNLRSQLADITVTRELPVFLSTCSSHANMGSACMLVFEDASRTLRMSWRFLVQKHDSRVSIEELWNDGSGTSFFSQLRLYSAFRDTSKKNVKLQVLGKGQLASVFIDDVFVVIWTAWDHEKQESMILSRAYDATDLTSVASNRERPFAKHQGLILRIVVTHDAENNVFVVAHLFDAITSPRMLLYKYRPELNTFTMISEASVIPLEISSFQNSLFMAMDLRAIRPNKLVLMIFSKQEGLVAYDIELRHDVPVTQRLFHQASDTGPPPTAFKSAWLFPSSGIMFTVSYTVDKLMEGSWKPKDWTVHDMVRKHVRAYQTLSGFPVSLELRAHAIPRNSGIRNPSQLFSMTCPLGSYCANGDMEPCPGKTFQTRKGLSKRFVEDCEIHNTCEVGYFCGSGAATPGSYVQLLEPSSRELVVAVFSGTQRSATFSWTNKGRHGRSIRMQLVSSSPPWVTSISLLHPTDLPRAVTTMSELVLFPQETITLNISFDLSRVENWRNSSEVSYDTNMLWQWWLDGTPTESFLFSVSITVNIVPILVVPKQLSFTLSADAQASNDLSRGIGSTTIFNILPASDIRVTVHAGCSESDPPPRWLHIEGSATNSSTVLKPGLGSRRDVIFEVSAKEAGDFIGSELEPASRLETCIRLNCTIDDKVNMIEEVRVTLVATQQCPVQYFSPGTGSNTQERGCLPCPNDEFQPLRGSTECIPAPKCPHGTFSVNRGLRLDDDSCIPCPKGTFQPTEGSTICLPCPGGFYSDREGSLQCTQCPDLLQGAVREGATSVHECESNPGFFKMYDPSQKRDLAEPCPKGINCSEPSTLTTLRLLPGYWRASLRSRNVRRCREESYCQGQQVHETIGENEGRRLTETEEDSSDIYCTENHRGVLCEDCTPGYEKRGSEGICERCNDSVVAKDETATSGVLIAILVTPTLIFLLLAFLVSPACRNHAKKLYISSNIRRLVMVEELLKVFKPVLGLILVAQGCASNFEESFPQVFSSFIQAFSLFYVNVSDFIDLGCALPYIRHTFYKSLLITTVGPMVAWVALRLLIYLGKRWILRWGDIKGANDLEALGFATWNFILSMLYPGVSNTIVKTFICEEFDDGRVALRTDYSIPCYNSQWKGFAIYAGIMIVVYIIGIPAYFSYQILYSKKHAISRLCGRFRLGLCRSESTTTSKSYSNEVMSFEEESNSDQKSFEGLWFLVVDYKSDYYYFEIIDNLVKLCQTSFILVLSEPWQQLMFLFAFTMAYIIGQALIQPYKSSDIQAVALFCQIAIVWFTMIALVYTLSDGEKTDLVAAEVFCFLGIFGPVSLALVFFVWRLLSVAIGNPDTRKEVEQAPQSPSDNVQDYEKLEDAKAGEYFAQSNLERNQSNAKLGEYPEEAIMIS